MADKAYKVGIIGHRTLDDQEGYYYVHLCCHEILSELKRKSALVTLAERKSRYVLAGQLRSKHSAGVTAKINSLTCTNATL